MNYDGIIPIDILEIGRSINNPYCSDRFISKNEFIIYHEEYNNFNFFITVHGRLNGFHGLDPRYSYLVGYIDVSDYSVFGKTEIQDKIKFNGFTEALEFAGTNKITFPDKKFLLGYNYGTTTCAHCHDCFGVVFGYYDGKVKKIKEDIKNVIDSFFPIIVKHDVEFGGLYD